jgi:hypothetical protein
MLERFPFSKHTIITSSLIAKPHCSAHTIKFQEKKKKLVYLTVLKKMVRLIQPMYFNLCSIS